ncbi:MAG: alpha-amylase family glycosyl hydrolase, partial [Paracoccaceae bacterium]|nr:alpha-amylase family glycosyl hydrolase [Paracoccaceae bacterium]
DGWACWAFSNHDVVRHPTRWNLSEEAIRLYAGLLLSLRGTVCLYQGEELGLTEAYVAYEDLQDPYGIEFWPKFRGRDGCRTPLPWVQDNANGGFTDAKPWLPMAVEHLDRAVARQDGDGESTLAFYRALIAFRKAHPAFAKGKLVIVGARDDYLSLVREHEGARVFAAFNLSAMETPVTLPNGTWRQDKGAPFRAVVSEKGIMLPPWQAYFAIGE